jgi:hypothetical protein
MELNKMIKDLIESGIIENQELALNILTSDQIDDETKRKHIEKFIDDFINGKVDFFTDERRNVFKGWAEIYQRTIKGEVKNRVKRIE